MWCTLDPAAGSEQARRRPALVLSAAAYNKKVGLAIVCPITSQQKGYPFEVPLPVLAGVSGVILADHVRSIDWRGRSTEYIGTVPSELLQKTKALLNSAISR
jgi:mRNA interferase MazF